MKEKLYRQTLNNVFLPSLDIYYLSMDEVSCVSVITDFQHPISEQTAIYGVSKLLIPYGVLEGTFWKPNSGYREDLIFLQLRL